LIEVRTMSTPQSFVLAWITYRWHQLSDNSPFWPTESKHSLVWSQNNCFISRSLGCAVRGHKLCQCTNRCLDEADPQRSTFILALTLYSICFYHNAVTFRNPTLCPHSLFTCFVWISEQTAIISLYSTNWLVCITETESAYCAIRTGYLSKFILSLAFRSLIGYILCDSLNWRTFEKDEVKIILLTNSHCAMTQAASCWPLTA
jgi:hypothetical protein